VEERSWLVDLVYCGRGIYVVSCAKHHLIWSAKVALRRLGSSQKIAEEVFGVHRSFGETAKCGKVVAKNENQKKRKKKASNFRGKNKNAKHHYHLGAKVEKGVAWGALGVPWDGLGRPLGPKSSAESTF